MKISHIGEFGLIERIKKILNNPSIGHDCASLTIGGKTVLATCDIMLEDRHFTGRYSARDVGFKSIAVNVSDIVASGGKPEYALISLMLPDLEYSYVKNLYQGIESACRLFGCKVMGGNVSKSDKIGIDVFMVGSTKKFIKRRCAGAGDYIFVTGFIGDSRAGLEILKKNSSSLESFEKTLVKRHLKPEVDLKIADYLVVNATSSMDVSDGLSSDLDRLFDKNKISVVLDPNKIPISKELKLFCKKYGYNATDYALAGGEDYKILFTQNKEKSPYYLIGRVKKGHGFFAGNKKIINRGFNHFAS